MIRETLAKIKQKVKKMLVVAEEDKENLLIKIAEYYSKKNKKIVFFVNDRNDSFVLYSLFINSGFELTNINIFNFLEMEVFNDYMRYKNYDCVIILKPRAYMAKWKKIINLIEPKCTIGVTEVSNNLEELKDFFWVVVNEPKPKEETEENKEDDELQNIIDKEKELRDIMRETPMEDLVNGYLKYKISKIDVKRYFKPKTFNEIETMRKIKRYKFVWTLHYCTSLNIPVPYKYEKVCKRLKLDKVPIYKNFENKEVDPLVLLKRLK